VSPVNCESFVDLLLVKKFFLRSLASAESGHLLVGKIRSHL
jgi:hypothetical protein